LTRDFFTKLEAELGSLTQSGVHLDAAAHGRRRVIIFIRRVAVTIALAVGLAASFDSEVPATASGASGAAHVWIVPEP
jgi:hypothetical protein